MATYQVADGHDNEAGYADISVQPRCAGIRFARRIPVISGLVYEDGERFAILIFNVLTPAQFDSLLTEFGVASTVTNDITITLPDDDRTFGNYNAKAIRPRPEFRNGLYRSTEFLCKLLEDT